MLRSFVKIDTEDVVQEIDKTKPVLATGGTGYLASWINKRMWKSLRSAVLIGIFI